MKVHMGLDVGSTTVKLVAIDDELNILYKVYERHFSDVKETVRKVINDAYKTFKNDTVTVAVTGSGGLSVHNFLDIDFIQEVVAGTKAIRTFAPETDVAIELGGEDSKITYLKGSVEQRMNSICAGGTGAFIDQMASLLKTDAKGLNDLAAKSEKIYPIASRCGVFAKTDVQALINQGASKEDIAVSVFQSVVNQTISNLACGRPIKGTVAFLGGPLHFLPELKKRFIETLELSDDEVVSPEDSQVFVAIGAAISSMDKKPISYIDLYNRANNDTKQFESNSQFLEPLFNSEEELKAFKARHRARDVERGELSAYEGPMYLGIDSGSTTTKLVLMSEDNKILYEYYGSNNGNPLEVVIEQLKIIYKNKNKNAFIKSSGCTGYGEDFIKAALNLDFGEVETIAHFTAAKYFEPEVDFIIDIGGQDMKSMKISDGVIESILLNEACSSGCGSFLETFANTVNMTSEEFANEALKSKNPVDLGSRCTVFMNSNVKQAQKEGAEVSDIAAGLAYSVIKNALQKVIKIRDPKEMGDHIVAQGGTFLSDAVLRAFEKTAGVQITRPAIAGLMGAYGMALIAKEKAKDVSSILNEEELKTFTYKKINTNCRQCTNNCALNVNIFSNGKRYITGNRCEKGSGIQKSSSEDRINMYKYKYERLFDYESLSEEEAKRGTVGIPRVLNIYENYPFWHTFFTQLGYRVLLSDTTTRKMYEEGIESITSETACYPAKLVHGHVENLIKKGLKFIFYPAVFYEQKENEHQQNHINCPVVAGYSEVIKNNVDSIYANKVKFMNPFLSFDDRKKLAARLAKIFPDIPKSEINKATIAAYKELDRYHLDLHEEGRRALKIIEEKGKPAIVLAGRPYHIDPEINHGIPELINSLGLDVLSEDSISSFTELGGRLRVLDQWTYHSRLYRAAKFVGEHPNLEMIQLNSFGCGLDAVTTDQVNEILHSYGKIYTVIKIDEINNLGAIKIRVRSLLEAVEKRDLKLKSYDYSFEPVIYTKEMEKKHTVLVPQMAPIHMAIFEDVFNSFGYNFKVLKHVSPHAVEYGLKYVNNDACYPSMFVVGQFMEAVLSGEYDTDNLTILMSQTGGACRASNYVAFIRKALKEAGYGHIPVLALSFQGIEKHPGLDLSLKKIVSLGPAMVRAMLYGDLIMRLTNATRPYEKIKGSSNILQKRWIEIAKEASKKSGRGEFKKYVHNMIIEYQRLECDNTKKPKVGIVGEILVKYLPEANNFLQDKLEAEGAEVVIPDLTDFMMYSFKNAEAKNELLSKGSAATMGTKLAIKYIEYYRQVIRDELSKSKYTEPKRVEELVDYAEEFVSLGNQYGEGWLLTAEMVELIEEGCENIVCVQPFGCLPNHITGKGVIKAIRGKYEKANIVPIDFDASASEVNQFNRIKLMLSQANENLKRPEKNKLESIGQNK